MNYIFLVLCGILSGVLGGMGMGGGTLLIPLLTLLFGFNQKVAQGINLIAFSIMAAIILVIHIKNKLVNVKVALQFGLVAIVFSCLGAYLANIIKASWLKVGFGILLITVAIFEAICEIKKQKNSEKNHKKIDIN